MALWKAISDRYELLRIAFDSGRVGAVQAEQISTLIWGRLDVAPGQSEGCLAGPDAYGRRRQSRRSPCPRPAGSPTPCPPRCEPALALETTGLDVSIRVKGIRESVERIRDQVAMMPLGGTRDRTQSDLVALERRLFDITERAKRGADVGGFLGPLEVDVAARERDLIVAASRRHESERDAARARALMTELAARGAIRSLQAQCLAAVTPAPMLAVPDVRALGAVPGGPRRHRCAARPSHSRWPDPRSSARDLCGRPRRTRRTTGSARCPGGASRLLTGRHRTGTRGSRADPHPTRRRLGEHPTSRWCVRGR